MGLSPKPFCGTEGAGMVRTCTGPVADRETGSEECRMGGGLELTCPDCYGTGHAITEILEEAMGFRLSAVRSMPSRQAAKWTALAEGLELAAVLLLERWHPEVLTRRRPATYVRDTVFAYRAMALPVPKAALLAAHKAWLRDRAGAA